LVAARRSCWRRLAVAAAVSRQRAGSHTGCSPTCIAASPAPATSRPSAAKKAQRLPAARAASTNWCATAANRSGAQMGAPATTQAPPVST
jgi:hypothetical protein